MKEILDLFKEYQDEEYASFQHKLAPTLDRDIFLGVRMPQIKEIAKKINNTDLAISFLHELPHKYYDENMLHSVLVSKIKDPSIALEELERFLPYVDNWATSDTLPPKIFNKHKDMILPYAKKWIESCETYKIRFGVDCLMTFFLDDDFDEEHLKIVGAIKSDEYYVNMMRAWYYATALAKQYEKTIKFIESKVLDKWTQNKSIQKAKESFRITTEQKEYLETLKIKMHI